MLLLGSKPQILCVLRAIKHSMTMKEEDEVKKANADASEATESTAEKDTSSEQEDNSSVNAPATSDVLDLCTEKPVADTFDDKAVVESAMENIDLNQTEKQNQEVNQASEGLLETTGEEAGDGLKEPEENPDSAEPETIMDQATEAEHHQTEEVTEEVNYQDVKSFNEIQLEPSSDLESVEVESTEGGTMYAEAVVATPQSDDDHDWVEAVIRRGTFPLDDEVLESTDDSELEDAAGPEKDIASIEDSIRRGTFVAEDKVLQSTDSEDDTDRVSLTRKKDSSQSEHNADRNTTDAVVEPNMQNESMHTSQSQASATISVRTSVVQDLVVYAPSETDAERELRENREAMIRSFSRSRDLLGDSSSNHQSSFAHTSSMPMGVILPSYYSMDFQARQNMFRSKSLTSVTKNNRSTRRCRCILISLVVLFAVTAIIGIVLFTLSRNNMIPSGTFKNIEDRAVKLWNGELVDEASNSSDISNTQP